MFEFDLIPKEIYFPVFNWSMFVLCFITGLFYWSSNGCEKLLRNNSVFNALILTIVLILFIGLRPNYWKFGDMYMYRHSWNMADVSSVTAMFDFKTEWFFEFVMKFCKALIPDVHFWFLIVSIFYIGCQFIACKKLLWENTWLAVLFVFFSYQFFTYGTNGLRNGMACSLMMLTIAFFCEKNRMAYFIGSIYFILAMGCHRSVMLPLASMIASIYVVKDIKTAVLLWVVCIFASLFMGGFFQGIFASLGFDDRFSEYNSVSDSTMSQFSRSGFRWDFLLYSAMPVWLAWHVTNMGIRDNTFTILANTYIISNSFWVLVCRVAFSNRFAYLSWFLYALVIAYAVIRIPIWRNQDKVAGWILFAHSGFTLIMYLLGK